MRGLTRWLMNRKYNTYIIIDCVIRKTVWMYFVVHALWTANFEIVPCCSHCTHEYHLYYCRLVLHIISVLPEHVSRVHAVSTRACALCTDIFSVEFRLRFICTYASPLSTLTTHKLRRLRPGDYTCTHHYYCCCYYYIYAYRQ